MDPLVEIMRFELDNLPGGIADVARKFLDTVCNDEQGGENGRNASEATAKLIKEKINE